MGVVATEQIMIELTKEIGEPGFQGSQTIWGCIFDAIRDLSLHAMPCWGVTEGLTLNAYNAFCWPSACVKPIMTFLTRNGKSLALSVDDNLLGTINKTTAVSEQDLDNELWQFFRTDLFYAVAPYNSWNFGLGEVYGLSTGFFKTGIVTYDPARRQSFVNGFTIQSTDTYGCFYKSDGLDSVPEWVPSQAKDAIESYALYKYYRTRNAPLGERMFAQYQRDFYRLSAWEADEGLTAWIDAFNSNTISAPKA